MSKICNNHLQDLNKVIIRKGMERLVAKDTQLARLRASAWLAGQCPAEHFDPLVVSVLEINQKGKEMFGALIKGGCPLCAAEQILKNNAAHEWIDNCTDAMVVVARVNHLIN